MLLLPLIVCESARKAQALRPEVRSIRRDAFDICESRLDLTPERYLCREITLGYGRHSSLRDLQEGSHAVYADDRLIGANKLRYPHSRCPEIRKGSRNNV
jgi:hypothetical protein